MEIKLQRINVIFSQFILNLINFNIKGKDKIRYLIFLTLIV